MNKATQVLVSYSMQTITPYYSLLSHPLLPSLSTYRQAIVGGILVGGVAQFLASPADLIKVQMQMEGRRVFEGKPPR